MLCLHRDRIYATIQNGHQSIFTHQLGSNNSAKVLTRPLLSFEKHLTSNSCVLGAGGKALALKELLVRNIGITGGQFRQDWSEDKPVLWGMQTAPHGAQGLAVKRWAGQLMEVWESLGNRGLGLIIVKIISTSRPIGIFMGFIQVQNAQETQR